MGNVAIVAIPEQEDYVWKLSSEKIPHMTLLNLGDALADEDIPHVMEYIEHAANLSLTRFYMSVDRRGPLGPNEADVLFFNKNSCGPEMVAAIDRFRSYLLREDKIHTAVDLTPQYEDWTPHLTLGYPETPAKPDLREYSGIHGVSFNKLALWVDDFAGPEFELGSWGSDLAMSATNDESLDHSGVKGMKWGIRRSREQRKAAREEQVQRHQDSVRTRELMKKKVSSLSNEELAFVNQRRQLETNYAKLNPPKAGRRKKKIENHLATLGLIEKTFTATQQPVAQLALKKALKSANTPRAQKVLKALIKP